MGRCSKIGGGCGQNHPRIELPADVFPNDLPWEQVAVLPPGALQGHHAARWQRLLGKHAQRGPSAAQQAPAPAAAAAGLTLLQGPRPAPERRSAAQQGPPVAEQRQEWDGRWECACGVWARAVRCKDCGQLGPCRWVPFPGLAPLWWRCNGAV
jgi:hypothetical protein